jgi:lipoprotein
MKKFVLLTLILCIVVTACSYSTVTISVQNNSNFSAVLDINYTKDNRGVVELQPNEIKTFSLPSSYTIKMAVKQKNITRNHLSFLSSTECVVENNLSVLYKIINTTKFKVKLEEKNNLFDTIEIDGISGNSPCIEKPLNVYSNRLDIKAIAVGYNITLKVEFQDSKIIIKL